MIARVAVPPEYKAWNRSWGAPYGLPVENALVVEQRLADPDPTRYGVFGFQHTSPTRLFEYPWSYHTARLRPGMRVLEIGGGISGFQFALALEGCAVTTVDPLLPEDDRWTVGLNGARGWFTTGDHARVNELFGTDVRLVPEAVQDHVGDDGTFDRVFCLSVLEHVDEAEAHAMLARVARLLAPGGLALLTVDLFLDVAPFARRASNFWGTNIDLAVVLDGIDLEMVHGDPRELHGFAAFDADRVLAQLGELRVSPVYPVMSQTVVLRRPAREDPTPTEGS